MPVFETVAAARALNIPVEALNDRLLSMAEARAMRPDLGRAHFDDLIASGELRVLQVGRQQRLVREQVMQVGRAPS